MAFPYEGKPCFSATYPAFSAPLLTSNIPPQLEGIHSTHPSLLSPERPKVGGGGTSRGSPGTGVCLHRCGVISTFVSSKGDDSAPLHVFLNWPTKTMLRRGQK